MFLFFIEGFNFNCFLVFGVRVELKFYVYFYYNYSVWVVVLVFSIKNFLERSILVSIV